MLRINLDTQQLYQNLAPNLCLQKDQIEHTEIQHYLLNTILFLLLNNKYTYYWLQMCRVGNHPEHQLVNMCHYNLVHFVYNINHHQSYNLKYHLHNIVRIKMKIQKCFIFKEMLIENVRNFVNKVIDHFALYATFA